MEEQFKKSFRASLTRQFEKLFTPKLPDAHLSRIIMYEGINSSAASGYQINKLEIERNHIKLNNDSVRVIFNDTIMLDFYLSKGKDVSNG